MKTFDKYLSNLLVGYVKLHNLHWNVVGINFKEVHEYLEELYDSFAAKFDAVAELQRMNGEFPLASVKDYLANTDIEEIPSQEISEKQAIEKALEIIKIQKDLAVQMQDESDENKLKGLDVMLDDHIGEYAKAIWFMESMIK